MTREMPGSKERPEDQPSDDERDRYFSRLTEFYSPYTFDVPDPHPAMDRPGWRIFRSGGGQSPREWVVAIVFLVALMAFAASVIVRTENIFRSAPSDEPFFVPAHSALQERVDRLFAEAGWYPHVLRVYDPDASGEVEVRTSLDEDAEAVAARMCADIASVAQAERIVVTSSVADPIHACSR